MKARILLGIALLLVGGVIGRGESGKDQGEGMAAPYLEVTNGEEAPPLRSTTVSATIAGVMADVRIQQVYENVGGSPIEAIYVFPGSTRAALYSMEMQVGERRTIAEIKEREVARRDYEQAKAEGKRSSLLEQKRPNVFEMNVANLMPGEKVTIDLRFTELLIPTEGEYQFVYPTVVGPRYASSSGEAPVESWVSNPYLKKGVESPATFSIEVDLSTGIPLQDLRSETHKIAIDFKEASQASVRLQPTAEAANNRDFILNYRLSGHQIQSGLLLSRGEKENFFALLMEPPTRVAASQIPPREYLFVIDVSGSMHGFPLDTARVVLKELFKTLQPSDRFNVLQFSGGSRKLSPASLPATAKNIEWACRELDEVQGGGGTELLPALREVLQTPAHDETSRSIVVITDGFVSCETEAFTLIRNHLNQANLFAFGIGSSVNRHLIEGIARAGKGEPFIVTHPSSAAKEAKRLVEYIQSPVLTQIEVETPGFEVSAVEPASAPDLLANRPVIVYGKWRGEAQGEVVVKGASGSGPFEKRFKVSEASVLEGTAALAHLWARSRIEDLSFQMAYRGGRESGELKQEITTLGLTYHLITQYTSLVAVEQEVVNPGGVQKQVKQPLPLPKGVENTALSQNHVPATPEPETWAMMGVLAGIILFQILKKRRQCA